MNYHLLSSDITCKFYLPLIWSTAHSKVKVYLIYDRDLLQEFNQFTILIMLGLLSSVDFLACSVVFLNFRCILWTIFTFLTFLALFSSSLVSLTRRKILVIQVSYLIDNFLHKQLFMWLMFHIFEVHLCLFELVVRRKVEMR